MNEKSDELVKPYAHEGFIPTLNGMGFMTTSLDPISKKFIQLTAKTRESILDIGAAYGVASLAALKAGATVYANDIDQRHLLILERDTPNDLKQNLHLCPGEFPKDLHFEKNSLSGVIMANIGHFFTGPQLEEAVKIIHSWLKVGGKLCIVSATVYVSPFKTLIAEYEQRQATGELWPGYFDNIHTVCPDLKDKLPSMMHFLDVDVLSRVCRSFDFHIEEALLSPRPDIPQWVQFDGRESAGIIATKKYVTGKSNES